MIGKIMSSTETKKGTVNVITNLCLSIKGSRYCFFITFCTPKQCVCVCVFIRSNLTVLKILLSEILPMM